MDKVNIELNNYRKRLFKRAVTVTNSLDDANYIVMGDHCSGNTENEKMKFLVSLYNFNEQDITDILEAGI